MLVDTLPLEEVEVDTLPLDEVEVETLPLDEVDTFPLEDVDTFPLLPPDADDVLLVLDTPPVLVDDPPAEVEVDPLVLDVDDTTMPLDPPDPLPPKNPPAKNPPPMPPPPVPPTSTGPGPKPPPDGAGISAPTKAGGRGTGAAWLATVTTVGAQTVLVRVTIRFTTRRGAGRAATRLVMTRLVIARLVISRFCDDSATCTAPRRSPHRHRHMRTVSPMPSSPTCRTTLPKKNPVDTARYRVGVHYAAPTRRNRKVRPVTHQ